MRTAGFSYVYILRRKDGGPLDSDDKAIIRQTTYEANRRVAADDGRAVIIGSNYDATPENIKPLMDRFAVETVTYAPAANANTAQPANK